MFIVWQSGKDVVRAGDAEERHCYNCDRDCPHSLLIRYAYTDFYWCLGIVSGYEYFLACDRCEAAIQIDAREAHEICPNKPIPFMRRFGCLLVLAILGAIFAVSTLSRM